MKSINEQIREGLREPQTVELDVEVPAPILEPQEFGRFPIKATRMSIIGPWFWVMLDASHLPALKTALGQGLSGPGTLGNLVALRLNVVKNEVTVIKLNF